MTVSTEQTLNLRDSFLFQVLSSSKDKYDLSYIGFESRSKSAELLTTLHCDHGK